MSCLRYMVGIHPARFRDDTGPVVREMSVAAREAHSKVERCQGAAQVLDHMLILSST